MDDAVQEATWDESDLEARLCRALDVAERVIGWFAADGYVDPEVAANSFLPEKPLAETAMLLYMASGCGSRPAVGRRIRDIAERLLPHARSRETLLGCALQPALSLDFAVPHILLTRLGYPDPPVDAFLRTCLASGARSGRERPPFGALEERWIESLLTGTGPGPAWHRDLRNSVLNRPLDLIGGRRDDNYAFTHLLMYCTDFGFRSAFLPRPRTAILAEAASLLATCLDAEDYDLAGEVLLAWPLTGAPWCGAAWFGLRVLARVEDHAGVLPGGTTRMERLSGLEGPEKTRYALATAYHTVYVMGFLCAASLRPSRAPPARIVGPRVDPGFVADLMAELDRDQGHWQAELPRLDEMKRHALAPLLLDLAIVQKCRKHDYQGLRELLVLAYRFGMARSPLCGQAAELLERLAAFSQVAPGAPRAT